MFVAQPVLPPSIPPHGPVPERKKTKSGTLPHIPTENEEISNNATSITNGNDNSPLKHVAQAGLNDGDQYLQHQEQRPQQPLPSHSTSSHVTGDVKSVEHDGLSHIKSRDASMPAPPDGVLMDHQGFSFGTVMSVESQNAPIEPPTPIQQNEFSMGSLVLTEREVKLLAAATAEDEKPLDSQRQQQYPLAPRHASTQPEPEAYNSVRGNAHSANGVPLPLSINVVQEVPAPVDLGLEPAGLSAGSMMSVGTILSAAEKLENAGLSFGSVMSFSTVNEGAEPVPGAVDGGLEHIGASFGSITIGTNAVANMPTATAPTPTQRQEAAWGTPRLSIRGLSIGTDLQRSKGNLLECSDTESEDEQETARISAQKSADWEKLRATFERQMQSGDSSAPSTLPPGVSLASRQTSTSRPGMLHIPTSPFRRDVSQMSAGSTGDDDVGSFQQNYYQYHPQQQQYLVPSPGEAGLDSLHDE